MSAKLKQKIGSITKNKVVMSRVFRRDREIEHIFLHFKGHGVLKTMILIQRHLITVKSFHETSF